MYCVHDIYINFQFGLSEVAPGDGAAPLELRGGAERGGRGAGVGRRAQVGAVADQRLGHGLVPALHSQVQS